MGALVSGPFIICTKTVTRSGDDTYTQEVLVQQYILQATGTDFPYTCEAVYGDNGGNVTISSSSTTVDRSRDSYPADYSYKDDIITYHVSYTTTFKYEYYDATTLALSSLMSPIGYYATYIKGTTKYSETKISVPFKGSFDGDNHTISNIEIITQSSSSGLFGYVNNSETQPAVIKNLNVNNAYISSPDNSYSGGLAAVIGYATITNCSISNSTIVGNIAGGIGSTLTTTTGSSTSRGAISGCTSANNKITGKTRAGGIAGSSADGIDKINNCTSSNNDITADDPSRVGPITGTRKSEEDQGTNIVITKEEAATMTGSSFVDIINALAGNRIPDFCFINYGISFDPTNYVDANTLARLKAELDGSRDVTDNLVLPNVTKIEQSINDIKTTSYTSTQIEEFCASSYANHGEFSNTYTANAISVSTAFSGTNINKYYYKDGQFHLASGSMTDEEQRKTQFYFLVEEGSTKTYYKYAKNSSYTSKTADWNNPRFTKQKPTTNPEEYGVTGSPEKFEYFYPGWTAYNTTLQNSYKSALESSINSAKSKDLSSLPDYYKLTAAGTDANPIVIDVTNGGGIYDKGGQLGDKIVKLKKSLYLQNWVALGITKIEDMGMGWIDTLTMDRKVNFLSNTQDNNDMAVVDWDYEQNNWGSNYLLAKHDLPYGKGIFVWSYNTAHPLAKEDDWDYTVVTSSNPILYQQGKVKAYTNVVTTNTEISNYISSLENLGSSNGSGATMGKWFLIANPYTAVMSADQILKHLTNDGTGNAIQGNCIYKYRVDAFGNGQYDSYDAGQRVYAGDAFFVAISESADNPANKLSGTISDQDLYGYSYEPVVSLSKKKSATNKSETTSLPKKMTFLCADSRKGLSQMTAFRYDNASNGFDVNDAYAMLSTAEKHSVEPFFVVDDIYLRHNAFTSLPYEVPIGFSSQREQQVTFSLIGATDSMEVYLMDAVADTIICDLNIQHEVYSIEDDDTLHFSSIGNYATIDVEEGKNEGKYKIHFGPYTVGIEDVPSTQKQIADIRIYNVNKEIHLRGERLKHVQVLNTLGQIIYEKNISGDEYTFSINAISGAYIIRALNEDGLSKNTKIIVH